MDVFPPRGRFWLAVFMSVLSGCATLNNHIALPPLAESVPPGCEVTLRLHYQGQFWGQKLIINSQESCIKKTGEDFVLPPNDVYLSLDYQRGRNSFRTLDQLCSHVESSVSDKPQRCRWNRQFHSAYPFDITIRSVNPTKPIAQMIRLVRILRNGNLVYTWNGAAPTDPVGNAIEIPGADLTGILMPYESDIDLRVIPANVIVDSAVVNQVAVKHVPAGQQEVQRLSQALTAVLSEPSLANGKLLGILDCFGQQLRVVQSAAMDLGRSLDISRDTAPLVSHECDADLASLREKVNLRRFSLLDEYERLKNQTGQELSKAEQQMEDKLRALTHVSQVYLDEAKTKARDELIRRLDALAKQSGGTGQSVQSIQNVRSRLGELDQMAQETLGFIDAGRGLMVELRKDAVRLAHDRIEQAHLFDSLASSLERQGSLFVPWTDNPKLLSGEKQLHMLYADRLQFFLLAPWHMIGFRVTGGGLPSLNLDNAVPAVDVVGMRIQWGKNRFADFRLGLGFVYVRDQYQATDGNQKDDRNLAMQVNAGLGNLKLGLGYTVTSPYHDVQAIRVLLGVDLIKLITGQNLEVR